MLTKPTTAMSWLLGAFFVVAIEQPIAGHDHGPGTDKTKIQISVSVRPSVHVQRASQSSSSRVPSLCVRSNFGGNLYRIIADWEDGNAFELKGISDEGRICHSSQAQLFQYLPEGANFPNSHLVIFFVSPE